MALTIVDIVPVSIDAQQINATVETIYTSPASEGSTKINSLYVTNDTTTSDQITLYNVPNGGSAGVTNIIAIAVTIPGDGMPVWFATENTPIWVEASGTIQAIADTADQFTIQGGGLEYKI